MKLLATGDLQIGNGLSLTDDRLADQERMWAWVVQEARRLEVDALLVPGDIWHRYPPTPAELLAFWKPLRNVEWFDQEELTHRRVKVIAIPGNHDSGGADRPTGLDVLAGPGLEVMGRPGWRKVGDGSVVALPWTPISRLVAAANGGSRDELYHEASLLLVDAARELRKDIDAAGVIGPSVLMAHWSVEGAVFADGRGIEEFMREPMLPLGELEDLGFDAVVLGHIHRSQMLSEKLPIFYTGTPWVGDWSEADSEHVVWLLELDGTQWATHEIPVPDRKFVTLEATPVDEGAWGLELPPIVPGELEGAVVRVRYSATAEQARRADDGALARDLAKTGAHHVIVKPQIEREERARVEALDEDLGPLEMLERWIESQEIEPEAAEELRRLTATYLEGELA